MILNAFPESSLGFGLSRIVFVLALALACPSFSAAVEDWPTGPGVEIGQVGAPGHLASGYEPSGAVWHEGRSRLLIVGDGGVVSEMNADGDSVVTFPVGGDLEGIALPDANGDLVLIGREQPDGVLEFDLAAGALTGNSWDLTPWMTGPSNSGLEALTVVGDSVYAGLQDTGEIFVFVLSSNGAVAHVTTLPPPLGLDDIAGLHYDSQTGVLFALFDTHDRLLEMSPDGTVHREYVVPGNDQEGFALIGGAAPGSTDVFIAEDLQEVWRYSGFPIGTSSGTSVPDSRATGTRLSAFPNPFRSSASVRADHSEAGALTGAVFDTGGRRIRTLVSGPGRAGAAELTWHGRDAQGRRVPAGVYFIRLVTPLGPRCAKVIRLD